VFERAEEFPTPEEQLRECPAPRSPAAVAALAAETLVRAAHAERGLRFAICRATDPYGPTQLPSGPPWSGSVVLDLATSALAGDAALRVRGSGEHTRTPTHVDDLAAGIVAAMSAPAAENEDFNLAGPHELAIAEIARIVWAALDRDPATFAIELIAAPGDDVPRRWPAAAKARDRLGWEPLIAPADGIAATVRGLRGQRAAGPPGDGGRGAAGLLRGGEPRSRSIGSRA
jgi:nucleoside-diphosphate-sugar epimerase